MATSPDETYVQTFQNYLKHKDGSEDLKKAISNQTTTTKVLRPVLKSNKNCKVCKVASKPGEICRILNTGLYHKYTSSQDYFYTRDINALLTKKKKPFSIRYNDNLIYDECEERLRGYYKKKEARMLTKEIKDFYSKFKCFPRNFHPYFYNVVNSYIRKHRRLEYIRVFKGEDESLLNEEDSNKKLPKKQGKQEWEFNLMEMMGETFLHDNYKDYSDIAIGGMRLGKRRTTEDLIKEVKADFKALYNVPLNAVNEPKSEKFSNALYNNDYLLYSRRDSNTAEDMLKLIVNEFKDEDISRKASMTLAEKVLHQVSNKGSISISKQQQEGKRSPTSKHRSTAGLDLSPALRTTKKSIANMNFATVASLTQSQKIQQVQQAQQVQSPTLKHKEPITIASTLDKLEKLSPSKVLDQRKTSVKPSIENLNDVESSRAKLLANIYQFRSTRSKSGGLKSMGSLNKSPTNKARKTAGLNSDTQGFDSNDSKRMHSPCHMNIKSESHSPGRKLFRHEGERTPTSTDPGTFSPLTLDSPLGPRPRKRSNSQLFNFNLQEISLIKEEDKTEPTHQKSNSVIRRATTASRVRTINPSMQIQTLPTETSNNQSNHETRSPSVKLSMPKSIILTNTGQIDQQRYQSPIEGKSPLLHYVPVDKKAKNLNIRAVKNSSPKRINRVSMASLSGRPQNLSDLSPGINSLLYTQNSLLVNKTQSQQGQQAKRKKIGGVDLQALAAKGIKRISMAAIGETDNVETVFEKEKERKSKRNLELNDGAFSPMKDLKSPGKESGLAQIYSMASTTTNSKAKLELTKNLLGSYTVKGSSKDIRFVLKK